MIHAYERILHQPKIIHHDITLRTFLAVGLISLHRVFRVLNIAKKYNLISSKLDANSFKDGSASFVGFTSVLTGYFGILNMDSIGSIPIAGYIFFMVYIYLKEPTFVLLDAVRNPQLSRKIKDFIEQNFQVGYQMFC